MEFWDIYDENKKPTGRTMKRNDWCLKDGEYHLTVLGVVGRPDGTFLITKRVMTKAWAPGWWEVSGGAAQAGEESCEAVLREERIRVREITTSWMCTVLSWILMRVTCTCRQRKQTDICLPLLMRSKPLQQKGNSCIMTV